MDSNRDIAFTFEIGQLMAFAIQQVVCNARCEANVDSRDAIAMGDDSGRDA